MAIKITVTEDGKKAVTYKVSNCFVPNNSESSPKESGRYFVIYSDEKHGAEFFDGNTWVVKYDHPVAYWFLT